jgi:hypothetical protein
MPDMGRSRLRIGCWNMDHWRRSDDDRRRAWAWLDQQDLDLMLLQEAAPGEGREAAWRREGIYPSKPWGSAVVSNGGKLEEIRQATARGAKHPEDLHRTSPGAWPPPGPRSPESS